MLDTTKPVVYFGLLAAPAVRAFLSSEPELREEIGAFFADRRPGPKADILDVAGPASTADILWAKDHPKEPVRLPVIRMHLRKVTNNTTGERGVEVKTTDSDHDKLVDWLRHSAVRSRLNQRISGL
ncbi:MAG: hypothetical protein WC722_19365 [Rhodospirillales bacterium]|jgi:hypothetical protein